MGKIINDEIGTFKKTIINPNNTIESSNQLIDFATNTINLFSDEKRIVTKMEIYAEYNNSDETEDAIFYNDNIHYRIHEELLNGLLILEDSTMKLRDGGIMYYKESESSLRDKIVEYLNIICSIGMMDSYQYKRFSNTIYNVYGILTNNGCSSYVDIDTIFNHMNLDYTIKHFEPTVACPDKFFKLIKNDNSIPILTTTVDPKVKEKLDEFIQRWFDNGKRKIYDRDRDEFYTEFTILYDSINNKTSEKGIITITRRSSSRTKKVIGMKPLINYTDINKILRHYGLNYSIKYHQETEKTDNGYKRRNLLSLE